MVVLDLVDVKNCNRSVYFGVRISCADCFHMASKLQAFLNRISGSG